MTSLHRIIIAAIFLIFFVNTPCAYSQTSQGELKAPSTVTESTHGQAPDTQYHQPESAAPKTPASTDLFEPPSNQEDHFFYQFFNMLFSLGSILVIVLIISWILKRALNTRMQQLNTNSLIKIIERRALTPKTTLYVLQIKGKDIAIAESLNGVTLLSHSTESPNPSDFEKMLHEKNS